MKTLTGIYGGSFNPIHNGHLAIARAAIDTGALQEVWLMVSPLNPLKQGGDLLCDELRLTMARQAIEGEQHIRVSDYEFHLPRPSYTWTTLQNLEHDYPDREFALLIGADNWALFPRWRNATDILASHRIFVYPRPGIQIEEHALPPHVRVIDTGLHDISSTDIRQRIRDHQSIEGLVPSRIVEMANQYYHYTES